MVCEVEVVVEVMYAVVTGIKGTESVRD